MAGDMKTTMVMDLDVLLGEVNDDRLVSGLAKLGDQVSSAVAKTSVEPEVKFKAKLNSKDVELSARELWNEYSSILDKAGEVAVSDSAKNSVATFRNYADNVDKALKAVKPPTRASTKSKAPQEFFNSIVGDDRDSLAEFNKLSASRQKAVINWVKTAEGSDNLLRQTVKSSESIRSNTGGKEPTPLLPFIAPDTKRLLDDNLNAYRKFYKAIGDTASAARLKESQNQIYRRNLLDPFLREDDRVSPKTLGESFSFAGARRAITSEVRRFNKELDQIVPESNTREARDAAQGLRDTAQGEIDKLEKLRRDLGNRFRELFGSTLGRGLEASKGQRDEALGEYRKRIEQYQNPELDRDTRLASLSSAKRELTRSLATAYAAQRATQDPAEKEDARLNVLGLEKRMRALTGILEIEREQGAETRRNTKEEKTRLRWADEKAAAEARALEAMRQMSQLPIGSRGYTQAKAEATDAAGTAKTLAKKLGEQSPGALPADVRFLAKQLGDSERVTGKAATKATQQAQLEATLKRAGTQTNDALDALKRVEFGSIDFEKQLARAKSAAGEYTSAAKRLGREDATDFKTYVDAKIKEVQQQGKQTSSRQVFDTSAEGIRKTLSDSTVKPPKDAGPLFEAGLIDSQREPGWKAKSRLVNMRIDDFLALAENFTPDPDKLKKVEDSLRAGEKLKKLSAMEGPVLWSQEKGTTSTVTGHEGRHRALALKNLGYETMPVVLSGDIRWSEQADPSKFDYKDVWPTTFVGQNGDVRPFPVNQADAASPYKAPVPFASSKDTISRLQGQMRGMQKLAEEAGGSALDDFAKLQDQVSARIGELRKQSITEDSTRLRSRFEALGTQLPGSENDLIKLLNKVKDIRKEVVKLDTEAAEVGFEEASASAKSLIDDLDVLRSDARRVVKATGPEAVARRKEKYLASVRAESERMEREDKRLRNQTNRQEVRLANQGFTPENMAALRTQFSSLGYRKDAISETLKGMVTSNALGVDGATADLQILQAKLLGVSAAAKDSGIPKLESEFRGLANAVGNAVGQVKKFDKRPPAEDFNAHVGVYRTRQTRIEALGGVQDALATQVSSLRSLMGNAQTEDRIRTLRILLAEALADVRHLGVESKKLGFEEGIGSALRLKKEISEIGDASKGVIREIKGPTAAELRRAEKERIRQALIDEGRGAFEDVGGIRNYARIPETQYKPALEYAKDLETQASSRFAAVKNDTTLDPALKKKQLRELTVEFNQASRAAKVLQQEINGNVGLFRQLGLASRNFARYFLFYGGMYQIIGYFTQMTRALVDFQDSLKQTQVIAQATNDDMVSIGSTIRDVSRNTGQSLQAVSDAAQTLAQAGVDVQSIPAALEAVSNFAMATGSNMQVASDVIASAKEIFDKDLTFLGASDQLTRAINISKLKAEDLKTIFNLGAQTAQTSGLTSAQFLGASATLSNLGIKSSTVATGLRQLLLEIFNPDEKTLQFLRKRYNQIGENRTDQEIRSRFSAFEKGSNPLVAALTELKRLGAAGSAQEDFRRVLDIRAENVGLPLMRRLDELVRNISRVSETGGAEKGAIDRMDTLKKSFEKLGTSAQLLGETFLDIVDGPLKGAADYLSQTIDRLRQYSEKLGREGRIPVAGVDDAVTGGIGGFAAGKLLGLGKFGTTLTTLVGTLANLAQAKLFEGTGKDVVGKAISWLTGLFSIFALLGKRKKVVGDGGVDPQTVVQVGIFAEGVGKLWGWITKAFTGGVLGKFTGAVSKLTSFAVGGPIAWLTTLAYTAYELYDWFHKADTKGAPNLDVIRRDAASAVKERDKLLDEQKAYDPTIKGSQSDQLNEGLAQAEKYKQTLNDMFGEKSGQVAKMFAELGSTSLESSTEVAKKFKARIEQEVLPKGKQLTARQFSRLIEAQSAMLQAQGLIATQQEKLTRDAVQIMKDTGGKLNAEQEKIVSAAEILNRDPVFGPNGFNPQSLVDKVLTLFQTLDLFVRDNSAKVDAASAQVKGPQQQIVDAEVQAMPERQMDLEVQAILSNPSKEGLDRLKQLREGYRKAYIDPIENDPARRAEPGKPVDTEKAKALEDQIAQKEARLKQFDEQVKQAEAGVAEKDKRAEEDKVAAADQAKADELRKAAAAKKAAEITEKEVALLDMRLKAKNLEDQWETEYAAARKAQNWDSLLKEKGLIDQTTAAKTQVAKAEQEIAELALRKLADEKGILDLPSDLSKITTEQKKLFLGDADVRSAYESYLDRTQAVTEATEEGKKRRRTIFEESKQIVPFVEGDAYRDRDNKIRDLNTQIRRIQMQGSEEHLALEKQKFDLQKTQLEEQIAHLQTQEGNYKLNEKGQGQYRAAMDDLQNKLKDLQDDYDEKVIRANKELRLKDADARVKKAKEELEYIRKQRDLVGQGPTSTRMQTIQLRGQAPATAPSYAPAGGISPNAQTAYEYFIRKGLKPYQAAGIVGGFMQEATPNVDPTIDEASGRGVGQWTKTRRADLEAYAARTRRSVDDLQTQLDFMWSELQGPERKAFRQLKATATVSQAAEEAATSYERAGTPKTENRVRYAQQVLAAMQGSGAAYGYRPIPGASAQGPSWDFPSNFRIGNGKKNDVFGMDKFRDRAPEIYQAMIGGALKWQEQGGRVVLRELDRKGGKPNHRNGYAADVQLIDKTGREIPNIRSTGQDFRDYEKFWQDGLAYARQWYPDADKYVRHGGYFVYDTGRDSMHSDVTKKYIPGTPDGAGGNLTTGANPLMRSKFPNLVSKGIPNGDWDAYFRQQFPDLAARGPTAGAPGATVRLPVFSDQFRPQTDLERIQDLTYREERAIDNYRRALLDQNRERGGGKEGEAAVYEQVGNEVSSSIRAQQETTVDNLRSKLQQQQVRLEQQQARGLRSGPADTAAREAAGLAAAPQDAYEMLIDLEAVLLDLRAQAQDNLEEAKKALETDKGVAAQLERDLQDPNLSEKDRGLLQKALDEKKNNIKAYDAAIIEFKRNINEADRGLGANRQQQQDVKPTFTSKEYPDGSRTYGQLEQGFDFKAIAGELNELAYSLKNLGRNIRGFIVGAVDTFVSTIADKLVKGAEEVDTAALNQARADLYQAQADRSLGAAQQGAELDKYNATMQGSTYDPAAVQQRREELQAARTQSIAAAAEREQAAQAQVKALEEQQGGGIGAALSQAFTALSQDFAAQMLKTIMLAPFERILNSLTGKADGSATNPYHVVNQDGSSIGGAGKPGTPGAPGETKEGGMFDGILKPLENIFYGIGDMFGGLFNSIMGWMGSLGGGGGSSWVGSAIGAIGSLVGFADGGQVKGPGTGSSDSIPAWLSNGEYVLTAAEVQKIGVQNIEKWKKAMASPAKFATGGLVQTFDSATRNAANYSNASATGGGSEINIIDQRAQGTSEPVTATRSQGPNGKEMINIMVRDAVKTAINSGMLDRTMQATYGTRRVGGRR